MKLPGFAPPAFTNIFNCREKLRRYKILPFEVRQDLKFLATGKRLCLCYVLCVWTLGRFKCVGWHGLGSGCGCETGNLFLDLFLPLLITNIASELAFLFSTPECLVLSWVKASSPVSQQFVLEDQKNIFLFASQRISWRGGGGNVFAWKIPW